MPEWVVTKGPHLVSGDTIFASSTIHEMPKVVDTTPSQASG